MKCQNCDGHGTVLLDRSWFTADGFTSSRCAVCQGDGENPPGFRAWSDCLANQRRKRALVAEWGGMRPAPVSTDGATP